MSFPRASRRRAIAAMSASRNGKTNAKTNDKSSARNRGSNRASHCRRPPRRHRPRSPRAAVKLQPPGIKASPIWLSGLKRRSASRRARYAQPALRHARRLRPIRQRAAIRRCPRRRAIPAPASKELRPTPISLIRTRPPSTTRSNKRWLICWDGRRRADVRRPASDSGRLEIHRLRLR